MKNYNLTVFDVSTKFDLASFFQEFSQVSDTEPLYSKLGKNYIFIFGSDIELVDLSTFITSITYELSMGFTITEINSDFVAYLPLEKFENLTLDFNNFKDKGKKMSKEKLLAIMNSENLNKVYANSNVFSKTNKQIKIEYDLDGILDKIANTGISSLTNEERNYLDNYSIKNKN